MDKLTSKPMNINLPGLTIRMVQFARNHDWGYDAVVLPSGTALRVGCDVVNRDGTITREFTDVRTMQELRDWAGY